jgi:hypothetical protein
MGTAFQQVVTLSVDVLSYLFGQHADETENRPTLAPLIGGKLNLELSERSRSLMVPFRFVGFSLWIRNRLQFFDQCPLHMLSQPSKEKFAGNTLCSNVLRI